MSAAQFKLSFDASKFDYASVSAGSYNPGTNTYVYLNYEDVADLGSVTFSFRAKATGTGAFNISGAKLSGGSTVVGASSTSVTVAAKSNTTPQKKPTNTNQQTPQEPEVVVKGELDAIKMELAEKVETDYTEESWKALQDAIARAEGATTNAEYDEIKGSLTLDSLVIADFEKEELFNMLIELIGKAQKDYTEESWQELQAAISTAQSAELKSEYDAVKDKLTVDTLVRKDGIRDIFENFIQGLEKGEPLYLAFVGLLLVLLLIIVILLIVLCRRRRKDKKQNISARRLK